MFSNNFVTTKKQLSKSSLWNWNCQIYPEWNYACQTEAV